MKVGDVVDVNWKPNRRRGVIVGICKNINGNCTLYKVDFYHEGTTKVSVQRTYEPASELTFIRAGKKKKKRNSATR